MLNYRTFVVRRRRLPFNRQPHHYEQDVLYPHGHRESAGQIEREGLGHNRSLPTKGVTGVDAMSNQRYTLALERSHYPDSGNLDD
jgi:hypothetical protein